MFNYVKKFYIYYCKGALVRTIGEHALQAKWFNRRRVPIEAHNLLILYPFRLKKA